MIINTRERWAYVGINKNGSTTLHEYLTLAPFDGINPEPTHQHRIELPVNAADFRVLIVVRDPFSRALSMWRHARCVEMPGIEFAEFLEQCPTNPDPFYSQRQADFLRPCRCEIIVRLEDLQRGLARFFGRQHLPPLPRLNPTDSENFATAYTPRLLDQVATLYRDDFEAFGYSRNKRPPSCP